MYTCRFDVLVVFAYLLSNTHLLLDDDTAMVTVSRRGGLGLHQCMLATQHGCNATVDVKRYSLKK